jgi:hypothetical protein
MFRRLPTCVGATLEDRLLKADARLVTITPGPTGSRRIGGFALVPWPAEYGRSGLTTFIVNQQGRVFQKDLGPKTASLASAMREYDPDASWTVSPD